MEYITQMNDVSMKVRILAAKLMVFCILINALLLTGN